MPKARGQQHNLVDAPEADTPPAPLEERSDHHQGDHLDPADRAHLWAHPASTHDPYPEATPAEPLAYPRWIHKRDEQGAIVASLIVPHADAHEAAKADGWS